MNTLDMEKIVIVKWKLKESEASRILKMLPELAEKTRNEEGNISYTIYQSESDPRELILHERYVDAAAAETHKQSQHYKRIVVNEIMPHLEVREVISVKNSFKLVADTKIARTLSVAHDLGSLAQAAEHLGRTPSAISLQMKRLQDDLGAELFRKRGRGLALTEARVVALVAF